jgi:hypothetical protein
VFGFGYQAVWLPSATYGIDQKIDDGLPRSGKMRAIHGSTLTGDPIRLWDIASASGRPTCTDKTTTPYRYNIQQIDSAGQKISLNSTNHFYLLCAVFIEAPF